MSSSQKILCIDDERANRVLVNKLLTSIGYTVLEAEDGTSGIRLAQQELPALILMDISMPEMDGYQTTRQLQSIPALANTPIVALTAHAMKGDREKILASGFIGYISKPIDTTEFIDYIHSLLNSTD